MNAKARMKDKITRIRERVNIILGEMFEDKYKTADLEAPPSEDGYDKTHDYLTAAYDDLSRAIEAVEKSNFGDWE